MVFTLQAADKVPLIDLHRELLAQLTLDEMVTS